MNAFLTLSPTEHRIRLAAIKLIARDGYEAMSLRELASEAGINSSSLYLYYKGKRELLLSLVQGYQDDLSATWQQCRPARGSAREQLQAFIGCHLRFHLLRREETLIGNLEARSLDATERTQVRQSRRAYLEQLQGILEQGARDGILSCDEPKLMARILCNMLTHACIWFRDDGKLGLQELEAHYVELVGKMLAA